MRRFTLMALAAVLLLTTNTVWAALPQIKNEADASNPVAPASKAAMWDSLTVFTSTGTIRCAAVGDGDNDTDTLETFIGMSAAPRDLRMITPLTATTQRSDLVYQGPANRGIQCLAVGNADSTPGNEIVFGTQQAAASLRSYVGMSKWNGSTWTTTLLDSSWLSTAANGQQVHSVKVGDINNDGANEIVYAMGDTLKMLRFNASTGLFDKSIILSYGVGTGAHIYGMDIGEFDADHAGIEIVIATNYGYVVEVFWNGSGWSTSNMYIPGAQGFMSPVVGDFDPDHAGNEVAFSRFSAPTTEIYEIYGGSAGTWTTAKIFTSAAGAQCNGLVVGDFDATHTGNELAYAQYGTKQVIQLKKTAGIWYDEVTFTGGAEMTDWWGLGGGNANPYHAGDELIACNSAPTTRRALRIQDRAVSTDWAMKTIYNDGLFATRPHLVYIQAQMQNNGTSANKAVFLNRVNRPDGSIQANALDSSAAAVNPGDFYTYSYSINADTIGKWAVAESMAVTGDSIAANDRKLGVFRAADLMAYPVNEGFETVLLPGANWDTITVASGAVAPAWSRVTAGTNPTITPRNASVGMARFNSYDASSGGQARLVLWPAFLPTAGYNFSFWMYNWTAGGDSMLVDISTDRGATWTKVAGYPLLGTAGWSEKTISLTSYVGDTVVIALRGRSAWGNNIFVDDIALTAPPAHDFAAGRILAPSSQMMVGSTFSPSAVFKNNGSTSENAYVFAEIKDNAGATLYKDSVDQAIVLFDSAAVTFAPFTASATGIDTMIFTAALVGDEVPANDRAVKTFTVVPVLPLAVNESFEGVQFPPMYWDTLRYNGTSTATWTRQTAGTYPTCTPYDGAAMARYESFNATAGNQMMLVSPYIGTNNANVVRLSFAMYGDPGYVTNYDSILVDVTNDDGATWTRGIAGFQRYNAAAAWRQFQADLGSFGNDTIRVALRAKSGYGNNMFVDQISIYDAPPTITFTSPADAATGVLVNVPVVIGFSEPIDPASFQFTFSDAGVLWADTTWTSGGDTVTLVQGGINAGNTYTFTVTAANDLAGNPLATGVVPNPFTFTTNADGNPPTITGISPAFGATDVGLSEPIFIAFSEPMDTTSFAGSTDPFHDFTAGWNAVGDTFNLVPQYPYAYSTTLSVILTAGRDLAGYSLVSLPDTAVSFTTIANEGAEITLVQEPSSTYDTLGSYVVRALLIDQLKAKVGVAADSLYYQIGNDAWMIMGHSAVSGDTFDYAIPGPVSKGTQVSYQVVAFDDGGIMTFSDVGTFTVLNPLAPSALTAAGLVTPFRAGLSWNAPSEEINNTDALPNWSWYGDPGDLQAVRFTPQYTPAKLTSAKFLFYNTPGNVQVHVWSDSNGIPGHDLMTPVTVPISQFYPNWTTVDLSAANVTVNGDYHIGFNYLAGAAPRILADVEEFTGRSQYIYLASTGQDTAWTPNAYWGGGDWFITSTVNYGPGAKAYASCTPSRRTTVSGGTSKHAEAVKGLAKLTPPKNISNYTIQRDSAGTGMTDWRTGLGVLAYQDSTLVEYTWYEYRVKAGYSGPDTAAYTSSFNLLADFTGPDGIHSTPPDADTAGTYVTYIDLIDSTGISNDSIYYWQPPTAGSPTVATHDSVTGGNRYWFHIVAATRDSVFYQFTGHDNSPWHNRGSSPVMSFRTNVGVAGKPETQVVRFFLGAASPNPVKGSAEFRFGLARDQRASLEIYNVLGQKVKTLVNGNLAAGNHSVKWDGCDQNGRKVSSGIYVYRLAAGENTSTRRFTVIR
jgi:hypothetical protein